MWEPIDTAPRDAEVVDLWSVTDQRYVSAWWSDADKCWKVGLDGRFSDNHFTHWMRLTDPYGRHVGKLR